MVTRNENTQQNEDTSLYTMKEKQTTKQNAFMEEKEFQYKISTEANATKGSVIIQLKNIKPEHQYILLYDKK